VALATWTHGREYVMRPDVVATVMGEGAVLLDLRTKYFYSANKTAWAILSALETGADVSALLSACARCAPEGAAPEAFFQFLQSENLLEPAASVGWDGRLALAGDWVEPVLEKHKEPLQRIMMSAFDPSVPLAE
jgi:hypothetical protein